MTNAAALSPPLDELNVNALAIGLPPGDVRAVVLVDCDEVAVLDGVFAQWPVASVLLLSPGPRLSGVWRSLAPDDPRRGRGFEGQIETPPRGEELPSVVVHELMRFFAVVESRPSQAMVIATDPASPIVLAVNDFCGAASRRFLNPRCQGRSRLPDGDEIVEGPLPWRVRRVLADFLFEQQDFLHALKLYWGIYRRRSDRHAGSRILECWARLDCPEWVVRWVEEPIFDENLRGKVRADYGAAAAALRRARETQLERNQAALLEVSGTAEALPSANGIEVALVKIADVPWRLRYDGSELKVIRDEYPLLLRTTGDELEELNPHPDVAELRVVTASLTTRGQPHALIYGWVRHAWAAEMLLRARIASPLTGWQRLVVLVEPDTTALSALLGTMDLAESLSTGGVALVGQRATRASVEHVLADSDMPVPEILIGVEDSYRQALLRLPSLRITEAAANVRILNQTYGEETLRSTLNVIEGRESRSLRVMLLTSRYSDVLQYVADDLANGFRALGHSAVVVREESPGRMIHYQSLTTRLMEQRPDLVVLFNHTRAEAFDFHPSELPYVTWIQDELPALKDETLIRRLGALDLTYGFTAGVAKGYQALGYPFVGHLPFAVNAEDLDRPMREDADDFVAFPTHVMDPLEPPFATGLRPWWGARVAAGEIMPMAFAQLEPYVDEARQDLGHLPWSSDERQQVLFFSLSLARYFDRLRVADTLLGAGIGLALYGRGWETLPRFAKHWRGLVAPGAPLRDALQRHKIVLHVSNGCNMHPRVLEGFIAGTFVLARWDPSDELPGSTREQFAIGEELCLFRNDVELLGHIRHAMGNEPWRRKFINAARARIRAEHTYSHRATLLLKDLRHRLRDRLHEGDVDAA